MLLVYSFRCRFDSQDSRGRRSFTDYFERFKI
jgi:hypothetical protein